ncbi:MAG: hypothetical protein JWM59_2683 [Verrucomicrobiales bacterium]|nr:hypothetical protein [Verrucomicrobiales bacterium]
MEQVLIFGFRFRIFNAGLHPRHFSGSPPFVLIASSFYSAFLPFSQKAMRSVLILLLLTLTAPAGNPDTAPGSASAPETLLLDHSPNSDSPSLPTGKPPDSLLPGLPLPSDSEPAPAIPSPAPPLLPSASHPPAPAPAQPVIPAPAGSAQVRSIPGLPKGAVPAPEINFQPKDQVGRTYSEDSPFVIWGGTREQRAHLFTTAGIVRRDVLDALHLGSALNHSIIIQLREPLAKGTDSRPPVWTAISQVPGGFRIEINIVPRMGSVPGPMLRENLVRATLADLILRGHEKNDLSGHHSPPPDWLLHGTLALMDYRKMGRMSSTFSMVFQLGRVLSVSEILGADPDGMDSVSMTIYRVSCCGLLMMLIEQPKGADQLQALLPDLALVDSDPSPVIERHFPSLSSSANGLSKWWTLQIAALSQPGLDEVQSPAETEQHLAEALTLRYTVKKQEAKKPGGNPLKRLFSKNKNTSANPADGPPSLGKDGIKTAAAPPPPVPAAEDEPVRTCGIEEFQKVMDLPDHEAILSKPDLDLTLLLLRAHPIYRPVIAEYQTAARNLAKGKKIKESAATLERLAAMRRKLTGTLQEIENTLDAYEASQSPDRSGVFEDYLRTASEFEQPPAPRLDLISRYLDSIEAEISQ